MNSRQDTEASYADSVTALSVRSCSLLPEGLPYGEVKLNMTRRIALNVAQTVETSAESS
jgi:hypothetical protein